MTMDGWTDRWVVWDEVFLFPLFFIYSGMAERRMELAYGADRKAEALTPWACGSKGLVRFLHSFPFPFALFICDE